MRTLLAPDSGFTLPDLPEVKPAGEGERFSLVMAMGVLLSPDGDILHADDGWEYNALSNAGQASIESVYLGGTTSPTKYEALLNQATVAKTAGTMTAVTEAGTPGSGGYARQQVLTTDWTDNGISPTDNQYSAAEKTFGPITGSALTATHMALCTTSTGAGVLICSVALSATTTIAVGQSFKLITRWVVT